MSLWERGLSVGREWEWGGGGCHGISGLWGGVAEPPRGEVVVVWHLSRNGETGLSDRALRGNQARPRQLCKRALLPALIHSFLHSSIQAL